MTKRELESLKTALWECGVDCAEWEGLDPMLKRLVNEVHRLWRQIDWLRARIS